MPRTGGSRGPHHHFTGTRIHRIYCGMIARCHSKSHSAFHHYGGRGITVCDRWRARFTNFLEDMGLPPTEKHTIDRLDPNGNYELTNCRWATYKEQWETRRPYKSGHTAFGECRTMAEWAKMAGVSRQALYLRLARCGNDLEKAISL